jgi:hypothetical protein
VVLCGHKPVVEVSSEVLGTDQHYSEALVVSLGAFGVGGH